MQTEKPPSENLLDKSCMLDVLQALGKMKLKPSLEKYIINPGLNAFPKIKFQGVYTYSQNLQSM